MTDFDGAAVLVTGATGGFGGHMVRQFGEAGGKLIITDREQSGLDRFAALQDSGFVAAAIAADLASESGCRTLFDAVAATGLSPDILINNAGIALAGRLDHVPADRWETLMQINLLAPMRLCAHFLPQMLARRSGHIVNISSLAGWVGSPNLSSYCASKFGLRGFSEALQSDLVDHGIRVSTVYPSFSKTPILDSEQFGFATRRTVPGKMLSDPADVVGNIMHGVRRNKLHIFPDRTARVTHYFARFLPAVIPVLQRRMERAMKRAA